MSTNERLSHRVAGIEEFIRVAETLSFVRAAESLGQAPSAVSKSVRLLESRLNARLLHRTTRSVSLTDEGTAFYNRASKWIADLEEMQSSIKGSAAELSGLIRVDMPAAFGRALFLPHLADFLSRHPKLTVEVRMNDHHIDLVAEGIDVALRIGDLIVSDLIVKPLGRMRLGTYVCPQCLERYGRPRAPDQLLKHRLIALMPESGRPKPMLYRAGTEDIVIDTRHCVASFTNGEAMMDAAIAGIGIAQIPSFYAAQALKQGTLAQVLKGQDSFGPSIQLVYPSRKQIPLRVSTLIAFLAETVEAALRQP